MTKFPMLLLATHRYCPLSALFTFDIVNCFASDDKLILGLVLMFIEDPFFFHENLGSGFPVTSHEKNVRLSPSVINAVKRTISP